MTITTMTYTYCKRLEAFRSFILPALLLVLIFVSDAGAQFYFGKNKVQYARFDWKVMTTEHFRIYFYEDEAEIARIAAHTAETAYGPLSAKFNFEISKKIPLIIYSSPGYFSQTNIVPGLLPESVGGFTEFLKGRVVIPFHGSYFDFRHVIRHELVHVFMLARLDHEIRRQSRLRYGWPPLWFTEGLAEHWSEEWDTEADMIVKDMVLTDHLFSIPRLRLIRGTYYMYKLGQSICSFIESEYGPDKLTMIFDNWTKGKDFDQVIKVTLGVNLEELSRKWEYSLKKRYFPELEKLGLPKMESSQLTHSGISLKGVPVEWDDGSGSRDWIVFMANRMGYTGLYMKPRSGASSGVRTLLKGERSAKFESLHLLRSGIDATSTGLVVFSSKSKERDVIYVYDLNRGKVTKRFEIPDLVSARSPRFSPDFERVVFTGVKRSGFSDLYILNLTDGKYTPVTDDIYYDIDPTFSLNGKEIVFVSDRGSKGQSGAINLYSIDIETGKTTQLTSGLYRDMTPEVTSRGIYFSSSREGSYNIFLLDSTGELTRQSTYVTGAFDPRLSPDGEHLVFTGYQDMGYNVYQMSLPEIPEPIATRLSPGIAAWYPKRIDSRISSTSIKYDTDYSFDIAQSSIAYDPVYGALGGFQGLVSDILGDHLFYMLVANTAENKDEFLESFNVGITYLNREKRANWGIGVFHLYDEYFNEFDQFFYERQAGVLGLFSYPVSRFSRFDIVTFARYWQKDRRFGLKDLEAMLMTNQVSWIYDNSLWDISGPIEGRRYNLSVGVTTSLSESRNHNRMVRTDLRHYFRLGKFSAYANRLYWYSSTGHEPQRIYFGGSWSFRGFNRREFYNRNILFASNEIRFPLIDDLLIGFPIGGLGFRAIRGALFFDVGSAWDDEFDQFLGSFGWGFRVSLGYLVVLRFDFARTTDFTTISDRTDFDFFFGWNF